MSALPSFPDVLDARSPAAGFDRFYFNAHGASREPFGVLGGGLYPAAGLVDGDVIALVDGCQRNLRVSDRRDA